MMLEVDELDGKKDTGAPITWCTCITGKTFKNRAL